MTQRISILVIAFLFITSELSAQIIFDLKYPSATSKFVHYLRPADNGFIFGGSFLMHTDSAGNDFNWIYDEHNRASYVSFDSGYVMVYTEPVGATFLRAHVLRYDKNGTLLWDKVFDSGLHRNFGEDVIVVGDTNFVYTGRHQSVTGSGAVLRRLSSSGKQQWESKWNADTWSSSYGQEIFQLDSTLFVIGKANASYDGNGTERDMFVSKHKLSTGQKRWSFTYQRDSIVDVTDLLVLDEDNVLLLGNSREDTLTAGTRGVLVSITGAQFTASEDWVKYFSGIENETLHAIEGASDHGYVILGRRDNINGETRTFIYKTDSLANVEWEYIFRPTSYSHLGVEMERSGPTEYVVAGHYIDPIQQANLFLMKFDISDLPDSMMVGANDVEITVNGRLQLYPNPVNDVLSILINDGNAEAKRFRVYDLKGQLVDEFVTSSEMVMYDCGWLSSGVYFVEVSIGGAVLRARILKP